MSKTSNVKMPRLRWRQRICRMLVVLGMLVALAYITLPWWAPKDMIRRYLVEQMSGQLGLDVEIDEMSMSWDEGVELKNFRIASPEGFSGGSGSTMLSAVAVRAELSPINLLWRRRISWMEVDRPVLNLEINADGDINANVLNRLKFDARTDCTSIRRAVVNVLLPRHAHRLVIGVQDMQVIAGRTKRLGRITMSAELRQDESAAPVALSLDTDQGASPVSATAFFNFSNVDMAQLNLVGILDLPLRKLAGRCGGSLDLQANEDGKIDHVRCNLTIRRLDLQPLDDRIKLPVVAEAGFSVSARYDPISKSVELKPFTVRLPGLDMSGTGKLFEEALAGSWRGINSLEMSGEIQPTQLAAMLTGKGELPARLGVSGPIRIELKLDHNEKKENVLQLSGILDGSTAEFTHADRVFKPAKRRLRAELQTRLEQRTYTLDVSNWRIWLGGNLLTGKGTVRDLRKLFSSPPDEKPAAPWDVLANWEWEGRAEIRDLDSFGDLAPAIERAIAGVKLSGPMTGEISVDSQGGIVAQGWIELPEGSALSRGDRLLKGPDRTVRLFGRASANRKAVGLDDVEVRLTVGEGRAVLDRGTIRFVRADAETGAGAQADINGDFETVGIEHILSILPEELTSGITARGSMSGEYAALLSPQAHRLHLAASDATDLEFRIGDLLSKASGSKAEGAIDFISDHELPAGLRNTVRFSWRTQHADLRTQVSFSVDEDSPRVAGGFHADIRDARSLARSSPLVARSLGPGKLNGSMTLDADVDWTPGSVRGRISCNADALGYESGDRIGRRKAPGTPLQFRMDGNLSVADDDRLAVSLDEMTILFGSSYARIAGRAGLVARTPKVVSIETWPRIMPSSLLKIGGRLTADKALTDISPELGDRVKEFGLGGYAELTASVETSDKGVSLALRVDGDRASMSNGGEFTKPVGMPARANVAARIPVDLSKLLITDLQARVGDLYAMADGSATLGRADPIEAQKMHVTVWTRKAESLAAIIPHLKQYSISGDAVVETELIGRRMPYVSVHSDSLSGVWRGGSVNVSGDLLIKDVVRDKDDRWTLSAFQAKKVRIQAGKNKAWLLADLENLDSAPAGSVTLLGRYVDTSDLRKRFGGPAATTRPASVAETKRDVEKMIASALPVIRTSNVKALVRISHLRLWEPVVSQYYDIRDMDLQASVRRGMIETNYICGLNAGSVRGGVKVNLKDDPPAGKPIEVSVWQDIRDVAARENIQPQLALFFPGNTVYGQFNRRQDVKVPLTDLVASALDPNVSANPVGTAKTVTIDGMTQGRAAPKVVTALFPGLNTARYRYLKMTAFSDLRSDGGAYSDMIFSGKTYDMYIEGDTDANKIGRYEIGLIVLGSPQTPEWNHIWRQGRLPILKFKARIEGGEMHDVSVNYLWPNESLEAILVRNNILYRAYLAVRNN